MRAIEDQLTPAELQAAIPELDQLMGFRRTLCDQSDAIAMLRRGQAQPFSCRKLDDDIAFFSDGGEPGQKSLVIAFCGRSHRLMLPWSLFLQHIPAKQFDVVIVADRSNSHFDNGVGAYASDLLGLTTRIRRDCSVDNYRRLYCFGTSTGGFPALRAGILSSAYRSIAVGGLPVWHVYRLRDAFAADVQAFDPLCACPWPHKGHLVCVYAAGRTEDYLAAQRLPASLNISRVPIAGTDQHNVIHEVFKIGRLHEVFAKFFDYEPSG